MIIIPKSTRVLIHGIKIPGSDPLYFVKVKLYIFLNSGDLTTRSVFRENMLNIKFMIKLIEWKNIIDNEAFILETKNVLKLPRVILKFYEIDYTNTTVIMHEQKRGEV